MTAKARKPRQPKAEVETDNLSPRERVARTIAQDLPEDEAALLGVAAEAISAFNAAVLASDDAAAEAAECRYDAVVWKLNGGTFFGCMADDDSAGSRVMAHCAAEPGAEPMWHQAGDFVIDVDGMRARVRVKPFANSYALEFNAVDVDKPFMSDTGYLSTFTDPKGGLTVRDVAERTARGEVKTRKARLIQVSSRASLREDLASSWVAGLIETGPSAPPPVFVEQGGQLAFAF